MNINKKIKNKIDNLKINDEISSNGEDYYFDEIDNEYGIYTFINISDKKDYKFLDYGDLFDIFFEEEMDYLANQ